MNTENIQKKAVDKVINSRASSVDKLKELNFNKIDSSIIKLYEENPFYFEEACKFIQQEISSNRLSPAYLNNIVMVKDCMLKFKAAEEK